MIREVQTLELVCDTEGCCHKEVITVKRMRGCWDWDVMPNELPEGWTEATEMLKWRGYPGAAHWRHNLYCKDCSNKRRSGKV